MTDQMSFRSGEFMLMKLFHRLRKHKRFYVLFGAAALLLIAALYFMIFVNVSGPTV